eukprot:CAMPEP_0203662220 /NCGR_PEP_ID=MMETSP0090-20130426/262_1 /ASSEMBLY_ACC=CAM_ASM_001088 /TAXON_ID=426623 /ORGANISM="Chaetoceros affinis, Strain CCMP159" /LENGTH=126 /DNA_ID=CAMNT_0050524977 /DNA_START=22 /DNA_END=402 /DNA_ORIENTATION=+
MTATSTCTSTGIILIFTSLLLFLLSLDAVGLISILGALQKLQSQLILPPEEPPSPMDEKLLPLWWTSFGNYNLNDFIISQPSSSLLSPSQISAALPLSVLLTLTSIPALSWLMIKYVSLRLHLGRN